MLMWVGRPLVQREWIQDGPFALHPENAEPEEHMVGRRDALGGRRERAAKVFAYKLWDDPATEASEYGDPLPWHGMFRALGQEDFYVTGHGARLYVAEESLDGASRDVFGYDLTNFTRAEERDFVYGGLNVAGRVMDRARHGDGRPTPVDHQHHVARARLPSVRRPGDAERTNTGGRTPPGS